MFIIMPTKITSTVGTRYVIRGKNVPPYRLCVLDTAQQKDMFVAYDPDEEVWEGMLLKLQSWLPDHANWHPTYATERYAKTLKKKSKYGDDNETKKTSHILSSSRTYTSGGQNYEQARSEKRSD